MTTIGPPGVPGIARGRGGVRLARGRVAAVRSLASGGSSSAWEPEEAAENGGSSSGGIRRLLSLVTWTAGGREAEALATRNRHR